MYPRNDLNYSENFLHMLFSVPTEKYVIDPELARALEIILVLHMDHEQNASTSTVRTAGVLLSTLTSCSCEGCVMMLQASIGHGCSDVV